MCKWIKYKHVANKHVRCSPKQRKLTSLIFINVQLVSAFGWMVLLMDWIGSAKVLKETPIYSIMFNVYEICTKKRKKRESEKMKKKNTFNLHTCGFYVHSLSIFSVFSILNFKILNSFSLRNVFVMRPMKMNLYEFIRNCVCVWRVESFANFW